MFWSFSYIVFDTISWIFKYHIIMNYKDISVNILTLFCWFLADQFDDVIQLQNKHLDVFCFHNYYIDIACYIVWILDSTVYVTFMTQKILIAQTVCKLYPPHLMVYYNVMHYTQVTIQSYWHSDIQSYWQWHSHNDTVT